ncbi:MAG: hypothetical protein WCI51_19100 [Lentisphaerota bacterium]
MKLNKKNKIIVIAGITALLLFPLYELCFLLLHTHAPVPDPGRMTQKDAVKYLASKEFAALPESDQERYMKSLRKDKTGPPVPFANDLSQEERAAVFKNTRKLMQKEMKERMKSFFAMDKAAQDKFLDNMIKEMEERRKSGTAGGPGGGPPPGGQGGPSKAMIQHMLENTDSTSRAQMTEFMKRMEQRMTQPK